VLANESSLAEAAARGAAEHGVGSGASALVTGYRDVHRSLECELAEYLQRDRVLLCSSGYQANLAVLSALASRGDVIVQDRLCHASLIDGARLSGAELRRYPHLDLRGMEQQLKRPGSGHSLVVTDGVFSMDGDRADIAGLAGICGKYGAWLVVDDAHGFGVTGPGGRGCVAQAGLGQDEVPVLVGTLGKAFGCSGAFIAGSEELIDQVLNEGRTYLFTTAISPAITEAAREALKRVSADEWRRDNLNKRIAQFREGARALALPIMDSDTPIQPLVVGEAANAMRISNELLARGLLVTAIRPPTVARGSPRLRVALSAGHDESQVSQLLEALSECMVIR
jgi:8-amino-7-oxononanoate synthase